MAEFVRVASVDEIPQGRGKAMEVRGRRLAVFHTRDGKFYAIDNACRHQGGPLADGELDGHTVFCPLHGWAYDITTGECLEDSERSVERFEIKVEDAGIWVRV